MTARRAFSQHQHILQDTGSGVLGSHLLFLLSAFAWNQPCVALSIWSRCNSWPCCPQTRQIALARCRCRRVRPIGTGSPCDVFAQNCWRTAPLAQNCWRTAPLLHHTLTLRRKLSLLEPANSWPPMFRNSTRCWHVCRARHHAGVRAVLRDSGGELCPNMRHRAQLP